jgi:GDPmannose 4,6-dehydratase
VRFDERYLRPTEVDDLVGDASKAERVLGWRPTVRAPELARLMVDAEIAALSPAPAAPVGAPVAPAAPELVGR